VGEGWKVFGWFLYINIHFKVGFFYYFFFFFFFLCAFFIRYNDNINGIHTHAMQSDKNLTQIWV